MSYAFGQTSKMRLSTCHPLLIALFERVIKRPDLPHDLTILCGHRGQAEQDAAFDSGASKLRYPKSKHNVYPSMAVDVAPWVRGAISWFAPDFLPIARHIKATWETMTEAERGGHTLSWGGDWTSFVDRPHWELR